MPKKRKPSNGRTPPRRTPKSKPPKRKRPKKRSAKAKPSRKSPTPRKKPQSRKHRKPARNKPQRYHDYDDVEVITGDDRVDPKYAPYPLPEIVRDDDEDYGEADLSGGDDEIPSYDDLIDLGERMLDEKEEGIEWLPTFDEVYDYIDALVEEFDLDAHELFELAFGYGEGEAA